MSKIKNVHYYDIDHIGFTYLGHEVRIRDPKDVMLVGSPEDEVEAWIMEYFGFLLSTLDEKEEENES